MEQVDRRRTLQAIEDFQQAVEKDPSYALAHAGLAHLYVLLGWNSYLPPRDAFPKAKMAAMTALQLDTDISETHTSMAGVLWLYDWQWPEAQTEFRRCLALNPAYPIANHWYAEYLLTMGCYVEAIARMKKSQELDPVSLIYQRCAWMGQLYGQAIRRRNRTTQANCGIGRKLSGGSPLMSAALAQTFAAAGRRSEAVEILDELTRLSKEKYIGPYFFAEIHAGLGQDDRAIEYLEKSYQERSHWLIYLHIDPSMDGLRSDPRFRDLLRRIGLPLQHAIPS